MHSTRLWIFILLIVLTPQTHNSQTPKPAPAKPSVIATADHEVAGVEVALLEVKRTAGDTLTIRFRYTNKSAARKTIQHGGQGLDAWRFGSDVYFVVPGTNQKYTPAKDADGYPVAARHDEFGTGITLAPKRIVNTWAKFPAPPAEVETITVYLPGAPPFEDVAIAK
jgi:hypothetical protein